MANDGKAFLGQGWSFPLAFTPDGEIQLAVHEEDIRQSIRIILSTSFGERVMRPDFGAGLHSVLFEPLSTTTMSLVQHNVERGLIEWEPRIDLLEVTVEADTGGVGRLLVNLQYRVRATNAFYNLVYPFYLLEGSPT